MKYVILGNIAIMCVYALCVTCAAAYFGNPKLLWWYVLLTMIGSNYERKESKDGGTEID